MKRVNVMDTATHIAIGVGLTALASQDPAMANTMAATATTLIAGSLIPDDTVLKLKNNATYISHIIVVSLILYHLQFCGLY